MVNEGEGTTEERKELCSGTSLMATQAYTKNKESPLDGSASMGYTRI